MLAAFRIPFLLGVSLFSALSFGALHETARFQFGGEGGWDYLMVDELQRELFIARADRVMVIDADSGKLKSEIPGLSGAHGVCVNEALSRGFASSGKSGEIVAFDLGTLKTLGKAHAGENPDAILCDPFSKRVFTFNGKSKDVTALDGASLKVLGTLPVGGKPEFAVTDENGHLYVNIEDKNELLSLDPQALKITARYRLAPCDEPTGLALDRATHRLIVGCGNSLALIVDAETGNVLQKFKVGHGVDAVAWDPAHKKAYVSAGDGTLSVLSESASGFQMIEEVKTLPGARTAAVDSKTGRVFLPFARYAPVPASAKGRPSVLPGTFGVLVLGN